jgi:filamentous hemagglutinin family protein
MSVQANDQPRREFKRTQPACLRLRPLCQAIALCALSMGAAHAGAATNLGYMAGALGNANRPGTGLGTTMPGGLNNLAQPQPSQQSVVNLGHVAAALSAQIAAQQAAAAAVVGVPTTVPNGLAAGGLQVLSGGTWSNAQAPMQSTVNGQTTVTVQQTAPQAVLDWSTFNIGRQTTLDFNQQGNASWAALNRVFDPTGVPSQILGQIKADGLIIIQNHNGVLFSAGSQVNTGSLVASSAMIDPNQFLATGIYSAQSGSSYTPSFTNAGGAILVAPGAQISTNAPGSVTQGGGYVLLMGSSVQNQGSIATPDGQTALAAGDNFSIRSGFSTTGNQGSTTIGNEIATQINAGSASGSVSNTGLIQSTTGDITLVGHNVTQGGVALSTTSVSTRGTIHLLNSAADTTGSITLTPDSVTSITDDPNSGTALDSQRAALLAASAADNLARSNAVGSSFDDLSNLVDLQDESRVEIVTGGTVEFQGNSLTLATGGQIAVSAVQRIQVDSNAMLDVAGSNITLPMAANQLAINIQGSELADSPGDRDSNDLNNGNVFVDARNLVFVPANTGGDANARDYTEGGLLEVSGQLADANHTIGEWTASGGTINLTTGAAGSVVAQTGSNFNISGGTIQYQSGFLAQSWLLGADGRIYNINTAPTSIQYVGLYQGFVESHPRWGITKDWMSPLIAPSQIFEAGYTVGKDAGTLMLSTPTSIFEGSIDAGVVDGQNQQGARPDAATITDPYLLSQTTVPLAGQLEVGQYGALGLQGAYVTDVQFDSGTGGTSSAGGSGDTGGSAPGAGSIGVADPIPASRLNTAWFDATSLSNESLGGVSVVTDGSIEVNAPLTLAAGGQLTLSGPTVDVAAALTAHGGAVNISNIIVTPPQTTTIALEATDGSAQLTLEGSGRIDTSGLFTNLQQDPGDIAGKAFVDGGAVTLVSSQGLDLAPGSVIDASSGGVVLPGGKTAGGAGGNMTITADQSVGSDLIGGQATSTTSPVGTAPLLLGGTLRSMGSADAGGGGALSLAALSVVIGDDVVQPGDAGTLVLPTSFFNQGFSAYAITGDQGLTVQPGAQIVVTEPTYQFTPAGFSAPTGSDPASVLQTVLLPLYMANPLNDTLTQRPGASLTLNGVGASNNGGPLTVGAGALLAVDPGQSITLNADAQMTIDGTLRAPGGSIALLNNRPVGGFDSTTNDPGGLSIWVGGDATLDVSGRAFTAVDTRGQSFGVVPDGGTITLGTAATGFQGQGQLDSSDVFIIIRPGALLDASGTSAALDATFDSMSSGMGSLSLGGRTGSNGNPASTVASNGGSITLNSDVGIYVDGTLRALPGGAGAAGGMLSVTMASPIYFPTSTTTNALLLPRMITISQAAAPSALPADLQAGQADAGMTVGQAQFSADALNAGGFDNLVLTASDVILFNGDVDLHTGQSITLSQGAISDSSTAGHVTISAPVVTFGGRTGVVPGDSNLFPLLSGGGVLQPSTGTLTVQANLIGIKDGVGIGIAGTDIQIGGSTIAYDFAGFGDVNFVSQGDIRFLGSTITPLSTGGPSEAGLSTAQNLSLTAAQVFPISGTRASVGAGEVLDIARINDLDPALPDSVFGSISLGAPVVNQGGIVRAPLGTISIGGSVTNGTTTDDIVINLLPGSITSVSANGLTVPYGGTADGTSYTQNGTPVTAPVFVPTINLVGQSVSVAAGATLDLSGGGTVTGAGFVAGSGGSVDVLATALVNANPANGAYSGKNNPVYAIIPGFGAGSSGYAPSAPGEGTTPGVGQQITIAAGVPGLPAGTYTLLPADYALLPGGYRVELGKTGQNASNGALALGNGSYEIGAHSSVANTGIASALPTEVVVTPGATVLTYSNYNQTNLSDFLTAQANTLGQLPPIIAADAGALVMVLAAPNPSGSASATGPLAPSLSFQGTALFAPAAGGQPGSASVTSAGDIEIYAAAPTPGFGGISLGVADLNAIGAPRLVIGGIGGSRGFTSQSETGVNDNVTVDTGVVLAAPEIFLLATHDVTLQPGAEIDTIGTGAAPDSSNLVYTAGTSTVLAASNGALDFLGTSTSAGAITIGAGATILSEGTIAIATAGPVDIDSAAHFGTQNLNLDVGTINIGSTNGAVVPTGYSLTQAELDTLLGGDAALNIPAVQMLTLSAFNSINFFGSVDLNVAGPAGSAATTLALNTPAVYGFGGSDANASLTVGTLIWNGIERGTTSAANHTVGANAPPVGIVAGGPGTGSGTLTLNANQVVFGFAPNQVPDDQVTLDRLIEGFATVDINAASITANNKGTLAVYQTPAAVNGGVGTGGTLNLNTPLLTAASAAVMGYTAGAQLNVAPPAGATASTDTPQNLGGEIDLTGNTVSITSAVVLPSGKLVVTADGDITLAPGARVDLSGQAVPIFDQTSYTPGGTVILQSNAGNITQDAGATIDISALNANAGSLSANATQGAADFNGTVLGGVGGNNAAGFTAGSFAVSGQSIGDFAALNTMLDAGGVFGARSFDIRQGDLTIGDGVKAQSVTVSLDNGSLTVDGLIDASGATPGSISLSAKNNLTLTATAMLDAHGTVLQTDSYGAPIDAENRGSVALTASTGQLALQPGTTIDVSTPDGVARGDIELNAPRVGTDDIAISASGPLNINGAGTIAVNGFRTYTDAPEAADASADAPDQLITQAYLDSINLDSQAFINAAASNTDLQSRLSGFAAFGAAYHLRPGVEIDSATPTGDLTVSGDINLANYRYGPGVNAAIAGSGEPGVLVIRAGGNLNVDGSISDGFGTPPATPDDNGWQLLPGSTLSFNLSAPESITLVGAASGNATSFATRGSLTYAIPIRATTVDANALVPIAVTTAGDLTLVNAYVTTAPIQEPDGTQVARGTILAAGTVVPAGSVLGAGTVWPGAVSITAMTIPAGTPLGIFASLTLSGNITVRTGQLIPAGTVVQLAIISGAQSSALTLSAPLTVAAGTTLTGGTALVLPDTVAIANGAKLQRNEPIPFAFSASTAVNNVPAFVASADIHSASGALLFSQGQSVPAGTNFPAGTQYAAGSVIPVSNGQTTVSASAMTLAAGTSLAVFSGVVKLAGSETFAAGDIIPAGSTIVNANPDLALRPSGPDGTQGAIWAIAPMLPAGDLSWSIALLAGADTTAADTHILQSAASLNGAGNIELSDPHFGNGTTLNAPSFSVVRTGTGSLSLLAGGDLDEDSLFGVYTAGTQSPTPAGTDAASFNLTGAPQATPLSGANAAGYLAANAGYQAYYPDGGGDLRIQVGGNLTGLFVAAVNSNVAGANVDNSADWLFSHAGDNVDPATAWWINFGTYTSQGLGLTVLGGFTGFGTLGGGNVTIDVGGNAASGFAGPAASGSALNASVASTGRVTSASTLVQTGGGDLTIDIGGSLNASAGPADSEPEHVSAGGVFTDLRGATTITAQSIGSIIMEHGFSSQFDPRTASPLAPSIVGSTDVDGGIVLVPGDGTVTVSTRGDLVVAGVDDPGGNSFTLWPASTGINLTSLGANVTPSEAFTERYPPTLNVTADAGNIVLVALPTGSNSNNVASALELAPAAFGQLTLLAADSIFGDNATVDISGADPAMESTPFHPGLSGPDTPTTDLHQNDPTQALIYAANGDITDFTFGQVLHFDPQLNPGLATTTWYVGAKSAVIHASGDIVSSGDPVDFPEGLEGGVTSTGNFILNANPSDVSVVQAGQDILFSSFQIGGPGVLDVEAGRNFYAGNHGTLVSVGPVFDITQANRSGGAGITLMAGVGAKGPDYTQFAALYFNPANQGTYNQTLADPSGTVLDTYNSQLFTWLQGRFGYTGTQADALAFFLALPTQQQGVFVRQVYFDELNAGGLDFNDPTAPDFKSYSRGQQAIAALFPTMSDNGTPITYSGDITLFSGEVSFDPVSGRIQATLTPPVRGGFPEQASDSGIHTEFGGSIQTLAPGGATLLGVTAGVTPGSSAGVLTEGSGDIDMYAEQSILLGQSRILTTFGGGIVAWSAEGDINGGEGAKTTVLFTPPSLTYTDDGEITLSSTVPSTGAGIGTLSPIPEVPPGDINLVTPLGTVNAGEAGIRVSGNLNVAALHVVNAANIQVQGKTTGIPVSAAVDTGALTAASSAASAVTQMAQNIVRNNANGVQQRHWIITVQVEGFGDDGSNAQPAKKRKPESVSYDPNSYMQVVGYGSLSPAQLAHMSDLGHLSEAERRSVEQNQ